MEGRLARLIAKVAFWTKDRAVELQQEDLPLRFGRYLLQEILGEGGMGRVFRAELQGPAGFRREVALKVLHAEGVSPERREELAREARVGALLDHPNVVAIHELGVEGGQFFIVMERVRGIPLDKLLHERGALPPAVALEIALQVCAGLACAHRLQVDGQVAGLVHRDLKPGNVLISRSGVVKLVDFGLVQLGQSVEGGQKLVGSTPYMSPEQILLQPVDQRSDLYAVGAVLYEMVAGERLFTAREFERLQEDIPRVDEMLESSSVVSRLSALPGLQELLRHCMARDPAARFSSASQLGEELASLLARTPRQDSLAEVLQAAGVSTDTAASFLRSTSKVVAARATLPERSDAFVGRGGDLDALRKRVNSGRLVTVKGPGGVGKTRLVKRFGRREMENFPGGVWFCDLSETRTLEGLLQAVAAGLDVPLGKGAPEELVMLLSHVMATRERSLVLLDNFEQVVEHAPPTLGWWLKLVPGASFLVTSQVRLELDDEQVLDLSPLPESDGVSLLLERARARGAWKELDPESAALVEIVRTLDGMPLAIELASARAGVLSPEQLLERLDERFRVLRGRKRGASARQSTLWDAIGWSWSLLSPWEQATLAQCSVFSGGFTMEAVEAVIDLGPQPEAPWEVDVVATLLDRSLLHSWDAGGQPRFAMYESIRAFAQQQLGESGEDARARHAACFARLGSRAWLRGLNRDQGTERWWALSRELDNLIVGAENALQSGASEHAAGCAKAAWSVLQRTGPFSFAADLLERVLEQELDPQVEPRVQASYAAVLDSCGRLDEARNHYERALAASIERGDRLRAGASHRQLGDLHRRQSRLGQAQEHLGKGLGIARELGDGWLEAAVLGDLGSMHRQQGHRERAREQTEAALALARSEGNRWLEGILFTNLADLHNQQGRSEEAQRCSEEALSIAREVGNRRNEANVLGNLGLLHQVAGRRREALEHFEAALVLAREVGNRQFEGIVLGNLGDLLIEEGELVRAQSCLEEAIVICDALQYPASGAFRGCLALIRSQEGDFDAARELLRAGEQELRGVHAGELCKLLCKRARVEHEAGDASAAVHALEKAGTITAELGAGEGSELGELLAETRVLVGRSSPRS